MRICCLSLSVNEKSLGFRLLAGKKKQFEGTFWTFPRLNNGLIEKIIGRLSDEDNLK